MEESNLSEQRKFMKKSDLLVILVLAGVFLGGWFWMRFPGAGATEENYAVLSINDQVLEVWPLAEHHNDLTVDLAPMASLGRQSSTMERCAWWMWTARTRCVNRWAM